MNEPQTPPQPGQVVTQITEAELAAVGRLMIDAQVARLLQLGVPLGSAVDLLLDTVAQMVSIVEPRERREEMLQAIRDGLPKSVSLRVKARKLPDTSLVKATRLPDGLPRFG